MLVNTLWQIRGQAKHNSIYEYIFCCARQFFGGDSLVSKMELELWVVVIVNLGAC